MNRINRKFRLILLFSFIACLANAEGLKDKLEALSKKYDFSFIKIKTDTFFSEKYCLKFEQPVDWQHPEDGHFTQRVFLSHLDFNRPVVFITEGYSAAYASDPRYVNELSKILEANQICAEHRYFGESVPKPIKWSQLTIYNAASDHHHIAEILKDIYTGPWIDTGISKGGQTTMYHRYFYPDDVVASVCYVAPLNFSTEDQRVYPFLAHVGDSNTRDRIYNFQYEMLKNKENYIPEFQQLAKEKKLNYDIGILKAYELTVLEYSFAFWQWGITPLDSIPVVPGSPAVMVKHLDRVAGIDWVSNQGIDRMRPFFYQALTQIGFYGYDISRFKNVVSFTENPTFEFTAPEGITVDYDPQPMSEVDCFIRHEARHMIFIYGENDPWSSTAVDLTYSNDLLKIVKPGGSHLTRIGNLPDEQQELIISTLKNWLGL